MGIGHLDIRVVQTKLIFGRPMISVAERDSEAGDTTVGLRPRPGGRNQKHIPNLEVQQRAKFSAPPLSTRNTALITVVLHPRLKRVENPKRG